MFIRDVLIGALLSAAALMAYVTATGGCSPPPVAVKAHASQGSAVSGALAVAERTQSRYFSLLEAAITGAISDEVGMCGGGEGGCELAKLKPYEPERRAYGNDWPPGGQTMIGLARMRNIRMAVEAVVADGVPGDFVELGVWRGGACIYAKVLLDTLEPRGKRRVVLFDIFGAIDQYESGTSFLAVSEEKVRANFEKYDALDDRVDFVKGLFKDTVDQHAADRAGAPIAVLRLDSNFYDSLQDSLYSFYEAVPVGGFVIFDDIRSHPDVRKSWDHFCTDQGVDEPLTLVDAKDPHSSWFRKRHAVKVDQSKRRPFFDVNKPK